MNHASYVAVEAQCPCPGWVFSQVDLLSVLSSLMGIEKRLRLANWRPLDGRRHFKVRMSETAVTLLVEQSRVPLLYPGAPVTFEDMPRRDIHPEWIEGGERFSCFVNSLMVVAVQGHPFRVPSSSYIGKGPNGDDAVAYMTHPRTGSFAW